MIKNPALQWDFFGRVLVPRCCRARELVGLCASIFSFRLKLCPKGEKKKSIFRCNPSRELPFAQLLRYLQLLSWHTTYNTNSKSIAKLKGREFLRSLSYLNTESNYSIALKLML